MKRDRHKPVAAFSFIKDPNERFTAIGLAEQQAKWARTRSRFRPERREPDVYDMTKYAYSHRLAVGFAIMRQRY